VNILLANPRGFCAGVDRAITIVEQALAIYGRPIYVRHEVVHNQYVVNDLRSKGAVFVDELSDIPDGATVIFSAHGVAMDVRDEAHRRKLQVLDATCPLVTKVHVEVSRYQREQRECILIGHAGHPEVVGTMGQYRPSGKGAIYLVETVDDVEKLRVHDPQNLAFVTQTTLSMDDTARIIDALRRRFPAIQGPRKDDICYATQNRQDAVKLLAQRCDVVLVVGSRNSSNSNRLKELVEATGVPAYLVDGADDLRREWLVDKNVVGVTAGASAPELLVRQLLDQLQEWGAQTVEELDGRVESIHFPLPRILTQAAAL